MLPTRLRSYSESSTIIISRSKRWRRSIGTVEAMTLRWLLITLRRSIAGIRLAGREFSPTAAWGRAIDINPMTNPYVKEETVLPPAGAARYLDRTKSWPGSILADGYVVKIFEAAGWTWGGRWKDRQDYQHFEKPDRRAALIDWQYRGSDLAEKPATESPRTVPQSPQPTTFADQFSSQVLQLFLTSRQSR